jgi:Domain of unknown function (DUF4389)
MIHTFEPQTGAATGPVRSSRHWYIVASCLLAGALVCLSLAVIGMFSWDRQIQDFQRVPVPGQGEVTLTQPGEYVLYVETRGACCSWAVGSQDEPLASWSMRLAMGLANGSQEIPVGNWTGLPVSYDVGGHRGLTAMSFTIAHPGTYVIETRDVHAGAVTDLAVGRNIQRATLLPLVLLAAGLAALLGAVVSFVFTAVRRRRARRGLAQAPDVMGPGPWSPASSAPGASAPVLVEFAGPAPQHRGTVLFRAILAIPVLICLYFVRYVAWVVLVTGWFGALFTGRLPGYAASFLAGYQRWEVRTYAYLLLLTDKYPSFGVPDADYPVSVTISPGRLNRAAVLFRLVLTFPAWCVTTILWYGLGPILMIPVWLIVLIRGRMPQPLYEAIAACLRYWARMKAYWYLLTDVYPDGLFGDPAEPALSAPVAGWTGPAFSEAGHAVGWAVPSGQEPPVASAVPTAPAADLPVLLPGDYVAAAAAQTGPGVSAAAMATPGRLVLSRPGKRLVGLTLGIGAATPVALFALFFVQAVQAPSASPAPGSVPAVAAVPAPSIPPATPAPAPSSAAPAPVPRTVRWLNGLSLLSTDMTRAMGSGSQVLTNVSLRTTVRQLGRCSAELSALGPPAAQLRHLHRLAVRACRGFERGAGYFAAAARFMSPSGSATDQRKVNKLLDRGNAGVNRGSYLIARAVADGSLIGSPA